MTARFLLLLGFGLALTACEPQPAGEPVVRAELDDPLGAGEVVRASDSDAETEAEPEEETTPDTASACRPASFEGVSLTHCIADPAIHRISASLAPSSGSNFGTIEGWAGGRNVTDIAFVMNGGTYGDDLKPIGYFVANKDRLSELDRANSGPGNFYLKPNGVFFGTGGTWKVLGTNTFFSTVGNRPEFGTQSGPFLIINGEMHPEIQDNGPSRAIRNGVGVARDGKAHFVISNEAMSFGQLARFFRDELDVPNALYLDGGSALWDPASGRMDSGRVGPLLIVEKK